MSSSRPLDLIVVALFVKDDINCDFDKDVFSNCSLNCFPMLS